MIPVQRGRRRKMVKPGTNVTFDGARYKAVTQSDGCQGCTFANRPFECGDMPMCVDESTGDGVIFIEQKIYG